MARIVLVFICLMAASVFAAGCWDRIELEQRGFVIGVAIDEVEKKSFSEQQVSDDQSNRKDSMQKFKVTFQVVVPAALKMAEPKGGVSSSKAYFNVHVEGRTMQDVLAKLSSQLSRQPFLEHLKLIIVSEKVAATKYGFANVLDYFLRNNDARRNVSVMIAKGEASRALDIMPKSERTPVLFINNISRNGKELMRIHMDTRIGDVHEYLLKHESFTLQKLTVKNGDASLIGASVMDSKTNSLIGFLNESETQGLNYITGNNSRGLIEVEVEDNLVVFEVERSKKEIKVNASDPKHLNFHVVITMEGSISEAFEREDYLSDTTLDNLEKKVEAAVVKLTEETISKTRDEYKKDVLGFAAYLRENKPSIWQEVEENWDNGINYFSKSDITTSVTVKIRRIGSVNQTETR
ncbi:Ger(x)C family spore germination protein [Paenibacillus sp. MCAF20]